MEARACATALTVALRASQPDWQSRYLWSGIGDRVATMAAFALARLGRGVEAAAALQEGRTLMLTERLNADPRPRPASGGTALYLMSTVVGCAASPRRR